MNKFIVEVPEFIQSMLPDLPPEFPFNPPENPKQPAVSMPMIYVEEHERVEFRVKAYETLETKRLEGELNELGKKGWRLAQVVSGKKQWLFIFTRQASN